MAGGLFNFFGNIASIATPLVVGLILAKTGSFNLAILYVGMMGIIGAISYLFIVGPLKRLEMPQEARQLTHTLQAEQQQQE